MTRVVVDAATQSQLEAGGVMIELCNSSGRVLGHFYPLPKNRSPMEPRISEEELDRREREGGGRTLDEIMADLHGQK
jgi:hypothetical protein